MKASTPKKKVLLLHEKGIMLLAFLLNTKQDIEILFYNNSLLVKHLIKHNPNPPSIYPSHFGKLG